MSQILLLLSLLMSFWEPTANIDITCVGDSITYGAGIENREQNAFPQLLQEMLGENYAVHNFGVNGRTALQKGDYPYVETPSYQKALKSKPDLVFLMLGTNDSKIQNRRHLADFDADYRALIRSFQDLESRPRIVLMLPPPSFLEDTSSIWDPVIRGQIRPIIQQIAYEERLELIDLYPHFVERPDLMPDKIHPSAEGASIIARRLHEAVVSVEEVSFSLLSELEGGASAKPFNFHGFYGYDLEVNGRSSKIVAPKWTSPGRPWIWRARFWGHEPQTDIALLERGFHLVYTDVAGLFGSPKAVAIWDQFYQKMVDAGMPEKVALEGMSRGGLILYNWALANPEKVAAIYADAPVLDLKSWPGGKFAGKGSPSDWEKSKEVYGFTTETAAKAFGGHPVDQAQQIAAMNIPLLHVCGLADKVVPYAENTGLLAERIRAHGGQIQLINKEDIGHHPHSLKDPAPIVEFLLDACGQ